jgi:GTP-binding protein
MHPLFHQAQFLNAAHKTAQFPPDQGREVAFAGRSNVGKSSALNRLLQRKKLARTGSTPGRTQAIHFYRLDDERRLVDLPGYGFARVSKQVQAHWGQLIEGYLSRRQCLQGLVLLMDVRHPLRDQDGQLLDWADFAELPVHVLLTKADKAKRNEARKTLSFLESDLASRFPDFSIQLFSASEGTGVNEAQARLESWLGLEPRETGS